MEVVSRQAGDSMIYLQPFYVAVQNVSKPFGWHEEEVRAQQPWFAPFM